jgi:hypothetical protein
MFSYDVPRPGNADVCIIGVVIFQFYSSGRTHITGLHSKLDLVSQRAVDAACVAGEEAPVVAMEHNDGAVEQIVGAFCRGGEIPVAVEDAAFRVPGDKVGLMPVMPMLGQPDTMSCSQCQLCLEKGRMHSNDNILTKSTPVLFIHITGKIWRIHDPR